MGLFSSIGKIAATLGDTVTGGLFDLGGAMYGNAASKSAAKTQMDFQEGMSNTAYQRAVADMKAAGLNPALMYSSAGPASTPMGSSFTGAVPQFGSTSAKSTQARLNREIKNTQQEITRKERNLADKEEGEAFLKKEFKKYLIEHPELKELMFTAMIGKPAGVTGALFTGGAGGLPVAIYKAIKRMLTKDKVTYDTGWLNPTSASKNDKLSDEVQGAIGLLQKKYKELKSSIVRNVTKKGNKKLSVPELKLSPSGKPKGYVWPRKYINGKLNPLYGK